MKIKLTNGFHAVIDDCDFKKISFCLKWQMIMRGSGIKYAIGYKKIGVRAYKSPYMHREIMGLGFDDKRQVDHINGDGLDNRRANLRISTQQQNMMNRRPLKKYKGAYYHKRAKKWHARIEHFGKKISLGYHKTFRLAALAYNKKAKELFGDFARLNNV